MRTGLRVIQSGLARAEVSLVLTVAVLGAWSAQATASRVAVRGPTAGSARETVWRSGLVGCN